MRFDLLQPRNQKSDCQHFHGAFVLSSFSTPFLFLLPFSLSGVLRVKRSIFSWIGPHPRAIFSISQLDATRGGEREREMRDERREKRTRDWFSPPSSPFSNRNKIPSSGFFFSFPRATIGVLFCLSLFLSLSFCFETTLNARADQCFLVIIINIIAFTRTYSYT